MAPAPAVLKVNNEYVFDANGGIFNLSSVESTKVTLADGCSKPFKKTLALAAKPEPMILITELPVVGAALAINGVPLAAR